VSTARPLVLGIVSFVVLTLCACEEPSPDSEDSTAPVARLFSPQFALVEAPALFDARSSFDEDGDVLTFVLNAGDGAPAAQSVDGTFEHAYAGAGTFEVELLVTDEDGTTASAFADVVVVTDDASCSCELGCFEDAVCTPRGCEQFSSSETDDDDTPADAIDCE
jgi:PKD domain